MVINRNQETQSSNTQYIFAGYWTKPKEKIDVASLFKEFFNEETFSKK